MHRRDVLVVVLAIGLLATSVSAETPASPKEPALEPGKWEVVVTAESSLVREGALPVKLTQCIEPGNTNPVEGLIRSGECVMTGKSVSGHTLRWELECKSQSGGLNKGRGEFTSDGKTGKAMMELTSTFQGKPMTAKTTWEGKRVADQCDEPTPQ